MHPTWEKFLRLPRLPLRQWRIWWEYLDSNQGSQRQRIYSPPQITASAIRPNGARREDFHHRASTQHKPILYSKRILANSARVNLRLQNRELLFSVLRKTILFLHWKPHQRLTRRVEKYTLSSAMSFIYPSPLSLRRVQPTHKWELRVFISCK